MYSVIILAAVSFLLVGVYLAIRVTRKSVQNMQKAVPSVALRQGRNNALVCLSGVLLATGVLTVAIRHFCEWTLQQSFWASLGLLSGLVFATFIAGWFRSKGQAGPLVLDCGEHPTKRLFLVNAVIWSVFAALGTVAVLVAAFFGKNDVPIRSLLALLGLASFASCWFIMAFGGLQIAENGIWQYVELLKWDRIESYEWQGEQKRTLMLRTKTRLRFFGRGALPVPLEHRDAVDELLRKYVPGCEVVPAGNACNR